MKARTILLGAALLTSAVTAGEEKTTLAHPDILFVLIDSIKASHLGCYGYGRDTTPNIDRFAKAECVRFETVIPGGSWTIPAVMTLFTSLPADEHRRVMPNLPHDGKAVTFAETLRGAGYATVGITANGMVSHRFGYGKGFDLWDDLFGNLAARSRDDEGRLRLCEGDGADEDGPQPAEAPQSGEAALPLSLLHGPALGLLSAAAL